MKIIKPGVNPSDRTYEVTCKRCSCVFEFARTEARFECDQRNGNYLSIPCPTCSHLVTVAA